MDISINYDRTVDVTRLVDGDGDTTEYAAHLSDVSCHIQPLDDAFSETQNGQFGKEWLMFCDAVDILEGDHVTDGSTVYVVTGVESFAFLGRPRHMEIRIRKHA
ncbi:MAG: hypothetical protein WC331_09835 [Candidatus Omnitrophota bacterium]|jgi:hypothetical protein